MISTAIIGCGGMGRAHAGRLRKMDNVKLVGVCDEKQDRADALAAKIGVPASYDYHELLDKVEAVWVCTEPFKRLDIVTTCAAAGKHIFTEKPICVDLDEADRMITATREAGVKYMRGYVLRFTEPYRLIHDMFEAGSLGDLVTCWTRRYMPCDMTNRWYGDQEKSGGVTLDFGSHDCDWLRWIGGDAATVFAKTFRVRETVQADEHGQVLMSFERGGMGTMDVSWSSFVGESSVGLIGTKGGVVVGKDGAVLCRIGTDEEQIITSDSAMDIDPSGNLGQKDASGAIQSAGQRKETIQEHFFRCIEEDLQPLCSGEEGRKTLATIKAVQRSAERGCSVSVDEIG